MTLESFALASGSGATLTIDGATVCKSVPSGQLDKLVAEGAWLQWAAAAGGPAVGRHLPAVVATPDDATRTLVLRRVPGVDARRVVIENADPVCLELITEAVLFGFEKLCVIGGRQPAWDTGGWCASHLVSSLSTARKIHPVVNAVLAARHVSIDAVSLPNPLRDGAVAVTESLARCKPSWTQVLHGDLHLGNILVDRGGRTFYLVDPRGGWGTQLTFDPAYDIAKLLHESCYVAFRQSLTDVRTVASPAHVAFVGSTGRDDHAPLRSLADCNARLAQMVCRRFLGADPQLASRATLITGVLLLSVLRLPHTSRQAWQVLLAYGLRWLVAGVRTLRDGYDLQRCVRLWRGLAMAGPVPT
ncbi:phosphotransferase [Micromonospora sp. NPDC050397]|uniref:phosphotransferase n=1 Tax=Micromonospora sp. NPDC050397 TaxID=3364279 RepID=UPI003851371D